MAWERESDDLITRASITQQFDGLSGFYNDIAFGGLTTRIAATLAPDGAIRMEPSEFSLALVDVGIPISEITASYSVDFTGPRFAVQNLGMSALGGRILADPFEYSPGDPVNIIMLRPRSVQLQFMVDLAEFDDISLSGSISGRIPVTINSSTVTVTDGRLESDAPGGVIRYKAGAAAGVNAEIGLVSRALGNFQYDSLTSDVNYTETGDLILKMRLSGINPDMDARQPVILNLGVENNIPQLLRSLQATRDIEDILRKRGMN